MNNLKKKGIFSLMLVIAPILIYFFIFFLAGDFSDNFFGISYKSYKSSTSSLQLLTKGADNNSTTTTDNEINAADNSSNTSNDQGKTLINKGGALLLFGQDNKTAEDSNSKENKERELKKNESIVEKIDLNKVKAVKELFF